MKKIALIGLALAMSIGTASASNITFSPGQITGNFKSCTGGINSTSCSLYQNKRLTKDQEKTMWSALKKMDYPAKIVANSQKDYNAAIGGWKTSGDCSVFKVRDYSTNEAVNDAKYVYCQMHKKGYPVPKPKIVKNF